jgi:hypothetical protein
MVKKLCTSIIMLLLVISAVACDATKATDEVSIAVAPPEPPQASDVNGLGIKKSPPGINVYANLFCKSKDVFGKAYCMEGEEGQMHKDRVGVLTFNQYLLANNLQGIGPNDLVEKGKLYIIQVRVKALSQ